MTQSHQLTTTSLSPSSMTLPDAQEWQVMKEQSAYLLASGLLPKSIQKPEQVILIILKGRELGIPALQALTHINVISGKPTMSAELMLAQIYKMAPKTVIKFKERTNEKCVLEVKREGHGWESFTWTIADARTAGLTANPSWSKYPRAMLHARCVSEMARSLFPDAIAGISYTPEELGAHVDEEGAVIDVPAEEPKEKVVPQKPAQTAPEAAHPVIKVQVQKQAKTVNIEDPKWVNAIVAQLHSERKQWTEEQINRCLHLLHEKPWTQATYKEACEMVEFEADTRLT